MSFDHFRPSERFLKFPQSPKCKLGKRREALASSCHEGSCAHYTLVCSAQPGALTAFAQARLVLSTGLVAQTAHETRAVSVSLWP